MTITIKDVAKYAGVSISTVSRVINESKPVSPEARRKVEDAIEVLGYEPNEVARSLVTKKSNLIGVIVDDIGNHYVSQIVRGIEEIGRMYNYDIILCSSHGDASAEIKFMQLLRTKQVEGVILVSEILNKEISNYIKPFKNNFIYINRYYKLPELPIVSIDHELASKMMMEYLINQGHRKILYVTLEKDEDLAFEKEKLKAYYKSMEEISSSPFIYKTDNHKIHGGYKLGNKLIEKVKTDEITAIYCCQDELAIGLMNYFYDNNIQVPEDISIVGYGDISISAIYRPSLTTIRQPYYDIGAVSIRKILKQILGNTIDDKEIKLPVRLIERNSCKELKLI